MGGLIRVYRRLVYASWARSLEYRAQIVIWVLTWLFPLIMMAVWLAVVDEVGPTAGWNRSDFISYYVAAIVIDYLTSAWILYDWDEDIRTGDLSAKLVKPLDPLHHYVSELLGQKLFSLALVVPPFAVATWLSPAIQYRLDAAHAAVLVVSVVLGFGVNLAMAAAFAMLGFWSTQSRNLYLLWMGAGQFLSGWIAPLALFPAGFREVAYLLPFRGMIGFPIDLMMGRLSWGEIGMGLGVTAAWAGGFAVVYRVVWHFGLKRYEAVGG